MVGIRSFPIGMAYFQGPNVSLSLTIRPLLPQESNLPTRPFLQGHADMFLGEWNTRWWFRTFFIFTPDPWGRFPFLLIFFKGVAKNHQLEYLFGSTPHPLTVADPRS